VAEEFGAFSTPRNSSVARRCLFERDSPRIARCASAGVRAARTASSARGPGIGHATGDYNRSYLHRHRGRHRAPVRGPCRRYRSRHLHDRSQDDRRALNDRTRAIIAVHLFGPGRLTMVNQGHARRRGLYVLEDRPGRRANIRGSNRGSAMSHVSLLSGKNLGAYGDGGAALPTCAIAERIERTAHHGRTTLYSTRDRVQQPARRSPGGSPADQAPRLDEWNTNRRRAAEWYGRGVGAVRDQDAVRSKGSTHVYHLYVIDTNERDAMRNKLEEAGVATGSTIRCRSTYSCSRSSWLQAGDLPYCEAMAARSLSCPCSRARTRPVRRVAAIARLRPSGRSEEICGSHVFARRAARRWREGVAMIESVHGRWSRPRRSVQP